MNAQDSKTSQEHFRALLKAAGLSQAEAARQMRVSRRSVVEWCKDGGKQQAPYLARWFLERMKQDVHSMRKTPEDMGREAAQG